MIVKSVLAPSTIRRSQATSFTEITITSSLQIHRHIWIRYKTRTVIRNVLLVRWTMLLFSHLLTRHLFSRLHGHQFPSRFLPCTSTLSSSIVFSVAFTIFMYNRIAFARSFSKHFHVNIPDLNKREFPILFVLVIFIVAFGTYPLPILDGLHYSVSSLIYNSPMDLEATTIIQF